MSKEKNLKPEIKEFEKFELPKQQQDAVVGGARVRNSPPKKSK